MENYASNFSVMSDEETQNVDGGGIGLVILAGVCLAALVMGCCNGYSGNA